MFRRGLVLCSLIAAVAAAGCGSDKDGRRPGRPGRATTIQALLPADRVQAVPGSAAAAILDYWRFFRLGAWPVVASYYEPVVLHAIGPGDVTAALALGAGSLQQAPIVDLMTEPTYLGTAVTLVLSLTGKPYQVSLVLRHDHGRWLIIYDTLLDGELQALAADQVMEASNGALKSSDRGVEFAQARAAAVFRGLSSPRGGASRLIRSILSSEGLTPGP
jgi:hypothetical protein